MSLNTFSRNMVISLSKDKISNFDGIPKYNLLNLETHLLFYAKLIFDGFFSVSGNSSSNIATC